MRIPEKWDGEFDLIVVGSGIGGLSAAIAAHDRGIRVVVLERSTKVGGVTSYSWGQVWVGNNHLERELGIGDSRNDVLDYLKFVSGGYSLNSLASALIDNSPLACEYFAKKANVQWKIIKKYQDYYYGKASGAKENGRFLEVMPFDGKKLGEWYNAVRTSPHCPWGITHDEMMEIGLLSKEGRELLQKRRDERFLTMGPGLAASFLKAALDRKIPILTNFLVEQLIIEDRVVGVVGSNQNSSEKKAYRCTQGVALATGSYDWNQKLVKYYEHVPEYNTSTPPVVEGSGLIMGLGAGAIVATTPAAGEGAMVGFHVPGEDNEGKPLYRMGIAEMGLPHAILVNKEGMRFTDESFVRSAVSKIREFDGRNQTHPNFPMFLIFDQNHREKYFFGPFMPGEQLPNGLGVRANSIEELARVIYIEKEKLKYTVDRFNELARSGKDTDFGRGEYAWSNRWVGDPSSKPNPNLGPIEKPPFYAVQYTLVAAGEGSAGLVINEKSQVMNSYEEPIAGLFACGNAVAYLDIGAGYQSGFANCRGMTFGYLASQNT